MIHRLITLPTVESLSGVINERWDKTDDSLQWKTMFLLSMPQAEVIFNALNSCYTDNVCREQGFDEELVMEGLSILAGKKETK